MRSIIVFVFLLGFSFNQLHLVEIVSHVLNPVKVALDFNTDEELPSEESKEVEKEFEEFTNIKFQSRLSGNPYTLLKNNFTYVNLMYTQPYTQRDIKPPCLL